MVIVSVLEAFHHAAPANSWLLPIAGRTSPPLSLMKTISRKQPTCRRIRIENPQPGTNGYTSRATAESWVGTGRAKWTTLNSVRLQHGHVIAKCVETEVNRGIDAKWGYDQHVYGKLATLKQLSRDLPILGDKVKLLMRTNRTGPGLVAA